MPVCVLFLFFKQKTAYEMRISDWSSDVCSSDLAMSARLASGATNRGADFLLELRSEEIPARMQAGARAELEKLFRAQMAGAGVDELGRASCRERVCQYV